MIQCFKDLQHLVVSQSNWIFEMLPNVPNWLVNQHLLVLFLLPLVITVIIEN